MRKLAAGLFSSIDGVVEAPNEWQPGFDDEMGVALQRMLDEQDAVMLIRCAQRGSGLAGVIAGLGERRGTARLTR